MPLRRSLAKESGKKVPKKVTEASGESDPKVSETENSHRLEGKELGFIAI